MFLRTSDRQIGFIKFLKRFALKKEATYHGRNNYIILYPTRCNVARRRFIDINELFLLSKVKNIRICVCGLINTATCFDCPDHPSSGRAWIQIDSKWLKTSSCKITYLLTFLLTYSIT